MKSEIVAIDEVVTLPSPVNVTSPVPVNLRLSPSIDPSDVDKRYGSALIKSHDGDNSTVALSKESPENISDPAQTNLPVDDAGSTIIGAKITDSPLL